MARSTYVYTVHIGLGLVGGYTVKHEMLTAIGRWIAKDGNPDLLKVHRMRDGLFEFGGSVDVTADILNELEC